MGLELESRWDFVSFFFFWRSWKFWRSREFGNLKIAIAKFIWRWWRSKEFEGLEIEINWDEVCVGIFGILEIQRIWRLAIRIKIEIQNFWQFKSGRSETYSGFWEFRSRASFDLILEIRIWCEMKFLDLGNWILLCWTLFDVTRE